MGMPLSEHFCGLRGPKSHSFLEIWESGLESVLQMRFPFLHLARFVELNEREAFNESRAPPSLNDNAATRMKAFSCQISRARLRVYPAVGVGRFPISLSCESQLLT